LCHASPRAFLRTLSQAFTGEHGTLNLKELHVIVPTPIRLKLNDITVDRELQMRAEAKPEIVAEYAAAYKAGAKLPPLTIFYDGCSKRWLADGFQRYEAAKIAHEKIVHCEEFKGTRRDALLHAIGANGTHGARRTNADKRKAVLALLADTEWVKWSNREIAQRAKVSSTFVDGVKSENGIRGGANVCSEKKGASNGGKALQESPQCAKHKKSTPKKSENGDKPDENEEEFIPDEPDAATAPDATIPGSLPWLQAAYNIHHNTRALSAKLHEIIREWEALGQAAHPQIHEQSVTSHLKNAVAEIRMGQPYAVCPYCQGAGTCKDSYCGNVGWITKYKLGTVPDNMKANLLTVKDE
jgi:hypothetical protein